MKNWIHLKKMGLIIVLAVAVTSLVSCRHQVTPEKMADRFVKKISSELKFDDNQKAKLEEIKAIALDFHKKNKVEFVAKINQFKTDLLADQITEKYIEDRMNEHMNKKKELMKLLNPKIVELLKTLKPEQKKEIIEHIDDHLEMLSE